MTRQQYTAQIKLKGWTLTKALEHWEKSTVWYHRQVTGKQWQRERLSKMIDGLPCVVRDDDPLMPCTYYVHGANTAEEAKWITVEGSGESSLIDGDGVRRIVHELEVK